MTTTPPPSDDDVITVSNEPVMVSLVGEQPIPVLLPGLYYQFPEHLLVHTSLTAPVARRLARILPNARMVELKGSPYILDNIIKSLKEITSDYLRPVYNISGGTKLMAVAATLIAIKYEDLFMYLESENRRSRLYTYCYVKETLSTTKPIDIPELLTIDLYLKAHLPDVRYTGFHLDPDTRQLDAGGKFESAIYHALEQQGFEVKAGVRPEGVADQLEIDLVVRLGNQVGIAEIKTGDAKGESVKRGLDQLAMATGREYLGTYTARFLINGRQVGPQHKKLAEARGITIIELPNYDGSGSLSPDDSHRLAQTVRENLSPRGQKPGL